MSIDMSTDILYRSRGAQTTHDPFHLGEGESTVHLRTNWQCHWPTLLKIICGGYQKLSMVIDKV